MVGSYQAIRSRVLTEETCRKFGYQIGKLANGNDCHIAPYFNSSGEMVAQKIRPAKKEDMFVLGSLKEALLFGQYVNRSSGKRLVITEGELDCLSVSQAMDNKWPVVSVPTGADGAAKALKKHIEWLETFEEIVLMFDMDAPGKKAAAECAPLFSPGKCRIAALPLKDPSEMLKAGRAGEIVSAMFDARAYRPDGIRTFAEISALAKAAPETGLPWFDKRVTALTYGRRLGEVVVLGGGTGCGKTDYIMEQVIFDVATLRQKVGLFFFEQQNGETAKRLAGKAASRAFHIPDDGWTQDELDFAVDQIADLDAVYLNDHFGQTDWDLVKARIRFLAVSHGVKLFYVDNLSSLADPGNERQSLETLMAEFAGLCQELLIWGLVVSHLATPDGTPHEEGGHVALRHFKGARAIGHWAFYAFGLERDKTAEDPMERLVTTVICLKDRYTGRADGVKWKFLYDPATCRLNEMSEGMDLPKPPQDFRVREDSDAAALLS